MDCPCCPAFAHPRVLCIPPLYPQEAVRCQGQACGPARPCSQARSGPGSQHEHQLAELELVLAPRQGPRLLQPTCHVPRATAGAAGGSAPQHAAALFCHSFMQYTALAGGERLQAKQGFQWQGMPHRLVWFRGILHIRTAWCDSHNTDVCSIRLHQAQNQAATSVFSR